MNDRIADVQWSSMGNYKEFITTGMLENIIMHFFKARAHEEGP
jgi:hypothetical protein